jgi:hypothetical protein
MALEGSPLGLLRAAAARTREEGSASLMVEFTGFELPGEGETVMEVGRIDFSSGRTELGGIDFGRELCFRRDLQCRGPAELPVGPLTAGSPLWLVEVSQGAITVSPEGALWHRDVQVDCYETLIDLVVAEENSPYSLASPGGFSPAELRRIPGTIMLDSKGRLRVVDVELGGLRAKLTLEDYGQWAATTSLEWADQVSAPPDF